MDKTPNSVPESPGLAREANGHIIALANDLRPPISRDERFIGLFCECGCWRVAATTLAEYESKGGAWIEGHERA